MTFWTIQFLLRATAVIKLNTSTPSRSSSFSEETRAKQRAKATGRKQSQETIRKKIEATKGKKREKKLCPYCDQLVAVNGYARWHGALCRSKF